MFSASSMLRFIENAELDGIHLEPLGHLIHGRFGGIKSGDCTGAAHVGGCADISPGAAEGHAQIGNAVMVVRGFAAVLVISVGHRHVVDVIVLQRHELAVARRAQANALLSARADARRTGTSFCG